MKTNPYQRERCLKSIDDRYVSNFTVTNWDYYIISNRTKEQQQVKKYKYDSKVNITEIQQFLCKNKTQYYFVTSPFAVHGK